MDKPKVTTLADLEARAKSTAKSQKKESRVTIKDYLTNL